MLMMLCVMDSCFPTTSILLLPVERKSVMLMTLCDGFITKSAGKGFSVTVAIFGMGGGMCVGEYSDPVAV
jgi:hypothetical protein